MGFFSKVFKGIGKVFRKIGRGLKKVVGKIGKFMGKLGIVGQIGLSLLLPGVGAMFGKLAGAMMGSSSAIISGAGNVLNAAVNIGTKVGNAFSTITEGVTKVIGDVAGAALNKIPGAGEFLKDLTGGRLDITSKTFSGAWETAQNAITDVAAAGKDLFSMETLTSPNQYLKDIATKQVTEAARDQVVSSVPDSLAGPEIVDTTAVITETPSLLQPIEVTAQRIPTPPETTPGFMEEMKTAVIEAPKKLGEEAVSFVKEFPERLTSTVQSGIESTIKTGIAQAAGIKTTPEYNVTNVSGYVPTIDLSGTSDIGASPTQFDAVSYMANNSDMINMNPYGYSANIYNSALYQKQMQQYGYAV